MSGKIPEVDRTICIGCGFCVEVAPRTFALDRDKLALVFHADGDPEASIQEAMDGCPVAAISWQA